MRCNTSLPGDTTREGTASRERRPVSSRRQESTSEGEEEPAAAGAEPQTGIRRAVERTREPLAGAPKAQIPGCGVATWAPSGPISRILCLVRGRDHSSGPEVALGLEQPTRGCPARGGAGRAPCIPLFGLAPHGVYPAPGVAAGAVRSYRTFSPLPSGAGGVRRAVCFLWHFPSRRR